MVRRRWLAGSLVEELTLRNPHPLPVTVHLELELAADFAHVFDVKSGDQQRRDGARREHRPRSLDAALAPRRAGQHRDLHGSRARRVRPLRRNGALAPAHRRPGPRSPSRSRCSRCRPACPRTSSARPAGQRGADPRAVRVAHPRCRPWSPSTRGCPPPSTRRWPTWRRLRIVDRAHPDRAVVAAGAPWFMTLFGRDSLLTAWMTLPFDGSLAGGVLTSLADLQGREDDPASEEQPGRILHELRRHGGSGAFSSRSRYYGTVDATPLFVGLAAEAWRWRAIDEDALRAWRPAVGRAVDWVIGPGDSDGDGFVDYRRRDPSGLANQGWKDSWDGITRADGTLPDAPLALVEVQGYAYAALRGAAALAEVVDIGHSRRRPPPPGRDAQGPVQRGLLGPARLVRARPRRRRLAHRLAHHQPRARAVVGHRRRRQGAPLRRAAGRPGPLDRLGAAHPGALDGGVRPAELPQRLGVAARHRTVHRRRRALRVLGRRGPDGRRRPGGDPALRGSSAGAVRRRRPRRRPHAGGLPVLVLPAGVGLGLGAACSCARCSASSRRPTAPASSWCAPTSPPWRTCRSSAWSSPAGRCR